jgi:hypothetical protein
MKYLCGLLLLAAGAMAEDLDTYLDAEADPRLFIANFTSSLIQVNATILAYALIAVAVVGAVLVGLSFLFVETANTSDSSYGSYGNQYAYGQYARSNNNGFLDGLNIVSWISMLQDVYEKFDYNDLDCQKRLICEVMKEPGFYGAVAQKFKTGFQYAKYLEILDLPDDMRELLDEYMDANSRADQQKNCEEFFTCPYSIKDSMKRNVADTNNL